MSTRTSAPPRPYSPRSGEARIVVSLRLPPAVVASLDRLAWDRKSTRTQVVDAIIAEGLASAGYQP